MTFLDIIAWNGIVPLTGLSLMAGGLGIATKTPRRIGRAIKKGYIDIQGVEIKIPIIKFHDKMEANDWLSTYDECFDAFTSIGLMRNITCESVDGSAGQVDLYNVKRIIREFTSYYHNVSTLTEHDIDVRKFSESGYGMYFNSSDFNKTFLKHEFPIMRPYPPTDGCPAYFDTRALSIVVNSLDKKLGPDLLHGIFTKISRYIPVFITYVDMDGDNMRVENLEFVGKFKIYLFINGRADCIYYPGNDYFNELNYFSNLLSNLGIGMALERMNIDVALRHTENRYWFEHKKQVERAEAQKNQSKYVTFKRTFVRSNSAKVVGERKYEHITAPADMPEGFTGSYDDWMKFSAGELQTKVHHTKACNYDRLVLAPLRSDLTTSIRNNKNNNVITSSGMTEIVAYIKQHPDAVHYGDYFYCKANGMVFIPVDMKDATFFDYRFCLSYFNTFNCPSEEIFNEDRNAVEYNADAGVRSDLKFERTTMPCSDTKLRHYFFYNEWLYDQSLNIGDFIMWDVLQQVYEVKRGSSYLKINQELSCENYTKFTIELIGDLEDHDALVEMGTIERHPKHNVFHVVSIDQWCYLRGLKDRDVIIDRFNSMYRVVARDVRRRRY